jgi:predicted transcriptional regulator
METTFDLPASLVRRVRKLARERGTTASVIVQESLLHTLADSEAFSELADASATDWSPQHPEVHGVPVIGLASRSRHR